LAESVDDEKLWEGKCKLDLGVESRKQSQPKKRPKKKKRKTKRKNEPKEEPIEIFSWRKTFIMESRKRCIHHIHEMGENRKPFENIRLCEFCRKEDIRYRMITKTNAIKNYKLGEPLLLGADLFRLECTNPHYRRGYPMTLFLEKQVEELAIRVHGS